MGTNDHFKNRRQKLKERTKEHLTPKPNSFLIISEGSKTEPYYFEGLAEYINRNHGNSISVEKPTIKTQGEGKSTVSLVEAAARIASRAPIMYNQVWVVFDKDDFNDFDEAVELTSKYGFHAAWSNQSFEYWIYLHFNYSNAALHRDIWVSKLDEIYKKLKISKAGYTKSDANIFSVVTKYGSLRSAVNHAKRIASTYQNLPPSKCDPCTTVHNLIAELTPWISELL